MKKDVTRKLVDEHRLILRMLAVLERQADLTAGGSWPGYGFYLQAVDFIRNYADRFHHAKEEDILFEALVANGMPRQNSPVAAMLMEHDLGRAFVKGMESAATAALGGETGQNTVIAENARGYLNLLREHIGREDDILYPLAERVLPEDMRDAILDGYRLAEERSPTGFEERYRELVERCEAELFSQAA
jgi:hemerythrin-like domain-containing protein